MNISKSLLRKAFFGFCALSLCACGETMLMPNSPGTALHSSRADANGTAGHPLISPSATALPTSSPTSEPSMEPTADPGERASEPKAMPTVAPTSAPATDAEALIYSSPRPEAGLLTAGAWDDLNHWPFWLNLMQHTEWSGMSETWGLNTQQRISVQLKDAAGQPLADTPVRLLNASARILFEARTNLAGRAELFADLLTLPSQAQTAAELRIEVPSVQQNNTHPVSLPADPQQPLTIQLETSQHLPAVADLMLMIDTTGSMSDELAYLKQELDNVVNRIHSQSRQSVNLRLSANFYRDQGDAYVVRAFPFTEDLQQVKSQLAAQWADGGGDYPEAVDRALETAVSEQDWSSQARARLLFLVLDAPPHRGQENLQRLRTHLLQAAAQGIRIIPIASSGIDKETEFLLRMMAITTGGRYVFLTGDSGIGSGHIAPTIGQYQVEKLNDLMVKLASEYIHGTL